MFSRNNPLRAVERSIAHLETSIDKCVSGLRRAHIEPDRILGNLIGQHRAFASLRSSVRKEVRAWTVFHAVSLVGLDRIESSFSDFVADLEEVHRRLPPTHPQRTNGLLNSVHRETRKLGTAINKLDEQVRTQRVRVVQSHRGNMQEFVKIRAAVASIDQKGAKELDGDEVDYFCEWPGVDLDVPEQLEKIAKLILLNRDRHQKFELRCRLAKPGRPLMRARCIEFPSLNEVQEFALAWEEPQKIYVAATRPTWRIVWVFERESGGWYW